MMKFISITGEALPTTKGNSPSDTFDKSVVTYQTGSEIKTLTVTYVRYFAKVLQETNIYDEAREGVPVNRLVALLFLEKKPEVKESRHYINDMEVIHELFADFKLDDYLQKYAGLLVKESKPVATNQEEERNETVEVSTGE
ncbi:hypothetical protein [Brevibacillus daliensis]|uniref:hypothetical protein n=1 Tax=Brevibacillus daliensis TaxID=2892995 RepID=UPI001E5EE513|nr:hypothetical protein [Brevibacillus daliensis]